MYGADRSSDLCAKLHLKAESQEIDRIIEAFSARYFDCNPSTIFGSPGVVHTITAAMLMLNTDLHIAELNKHMTRTDFVRNALRAIGESLSMENSLKDSNGSTPDLVRDDSSKFGESATSIGTAPRNAPRSTSAPTMPLTLTRMESNTTAPGGVGMESSKSKGSSTTIGSFSYTKAWESDAENALKVSLSRTRLGVTIALDRN
jgi:PH/SEC7 domain-containing protein